MTVEKLINELKKWPKSYKIEDERGRYVTAVELDSFCASKGSVCIRFKYLKEYCKYCNQEIKINK